MLLQRPKLQSRRSRLKIALSSSFFRYMVLLDAYIRDPSFK